MILYLSFVLISLWSSIECIEYLVGFFLMLGGCSGCRGVQGWIGIYVVLCCGLVLCVLLLMCVVDDGCHKDFDTLDYIEGSKIIVLRYPMFILLILLVLYKSS